MKYLFVIDMQNDFIDGALGTAEAVSIVPAVAEKIRKFEGDGVFVTLDTHFSENYAKTLEGQKLPVPHCIINTPGHEVDPVVQEALDERGDYEIVPKYTFGALDLVNKLKDRFSGIRQEDMEFEIIGLCTDICVVSNALLLRAAFPDSRITVDAACCAGVTPELHNAALMTMQSCQMDIINSLESKGDDAVNSCNSNGDGAEDNEFAYELDYIFDAESQRDGAIEWIRSWFAENGPGSPAVIGISGGKDSTVVAALCARALGPDRVVGEINAFLMQSHEFFHGFRMLFQEFAADTHHDGSVDEAFAVSQDAGAGALRAQHFGAGYQSGVCFTR